jgi:transglutaminase-like putative cysteine protease
MARPWCGSPRGPIALGSLITLLAIAQPSLAQESWDAIYLGANGNKVGYYHTKVEKIKEDNRDLLRVRYDAFLKFKRDKDTVSIQQQYGTIEKPDGEVLKLETRVLLGQNEIRTYGEVRGDVMAMVLSAGNQKQQANIPWGPDVRGPYGAELSLSRQPLKPGETRSVKTFIPVLNKVAITTLTARDQEKVQLGGGVKRSLLRVDGTLTGLDGKPILEGNSTYWVDESGQILKSFTDVFGGQVTYRTTQEAAMSPIVGVFDLLKESLLKVKNKIPNPYKTRNVVYRLTMKDDDPSELFPADRRQKVDKKGDGHSVVIQVRTAGMNDGESGPEKVDDEYLRANTQINSEDAKVVELMRKAVGDRTDPWAKAVAIEHWVATNMVNVNFETAFANAEEVARTLSGDCSEHSVLTAAMCRAAGVPARVAVGLLYDEPHAGFGFHMWNEVYVNRRWVAIDAAFDQSDVDAVHLKMADSSLEGVSPFESFLTVSRLFQKAKIDSVEIR